MSHISTELSHASWASPAHPAGLHGYDTIIVAFSGGKDATACLLTLIDAGVPSNRIELHHHDVDGQGAPFMDWPSCSATSLMAGRIASPEMLPWPHPLPQLTCSRPEFTGDGHETDQHGNA